MKRSFLAPEILQVSAMDCGVAALTAFLAGYGVRASYEKLREACQTSVDGTSIDALEDIANDFGVRACQHLVPTDTFVEALSRRLPAVVVTALPGQPPHFAVVWRRFGSWLHVMDPARGREWVRKERLACDLFVMEMVFSEQEFRSWFTESSYREMLLGLCERVLDGEVARAVRSALSTADDPREVAAVDAALRLTARLDKKRGRGGAWRNEAFVRIRRTALSEPASIPAGLRGFTLDDEGNVRVRAAIALAPEMHDHPIVGAETATTLATAATASLRAKDHDGRLWVKLGRLLGRDARTLAWACGSALAATAIAAALEVLLYRAAWDAPRTLVTFGQRVSAVAVVGVLLVLVLLLEAAVLWGSRAIGRYLEVRLRLLTSALLPQVDDDFVRSRPTSDLAYRAHNLTLGREFPASIVRLARSALDLLVSIVALVALDAVNLAVATTGFVALAGAAFYARGKLRGIDARFQAHGARLLTIFLDALRGFLPIRLHGYQNALRAEQDRELSLWQATGSDQTTTRALLGAFDEALGVLVLLVLFVLHLKRSGDARVFVVLAFWAFRIPAAARSLFVAMESYPAQRSAFARLLEIADYAAESTVAPSDVANGSRRNGRREGVRVEFRDVAVLANGHAVLADVDLEIPAAQHVAIVGPSGAGKSSLASVILGLYRPTEGQIFVDGELLDRERLQRLRAVTAWVDPGAQLWNDSLFENLQYAARGYRRRDLLETLESSDLLSVLEGMEQGLNTPVGSDGRLVSGGEGQRLRLGRALLRSEARLVVLDEPFRGLDRTTRRMLAFRARLAWKEATILFISHDISHALDFDRVLVVDGGRIVEDGHPLELAGAPSRFATMLEAERGILDDTWSPARWQRVRIEDGRVKEVL
jgi:ATP-binding cassette subfamily B protein